MRIYIIGYMGSGKTKTADALSKLLKIDYVDTDKLVEAKIGKSISSIFETEGQEYFRNIESEVLRSTSNAKNLIVATGGGSPMYYDNMDWMNTNGITVYLEANHGLLFHRLASNRNDRPLLKNLSDIELMEQITGHLVLRIPVYRKAQITINAADLNVKSLATKISELKKSQ